MPYCINCGQQIREGANFCDNCGSPVSGSNSQSTERKTVYEGDIHKCPACGEAVPSYQTTCPSCGHEFRNTSSSNSIKEFENELNRIENSRKTEKRNGLRKAFATAFNQPIVDDVDQQLANKISNFAVPNNQEDIFEFMILAASNLDPIAYNTTNEGYSPAVKGGKLLVSNAWDSKYNQVHQKAKMMFPHDSRLIEIENLYSSKQKQIKKAKFKLAKFLLIYFGSIFIIAAVIWIGVASHDHKIDRKTASLDAQLNSIVAEIQTDIANGDYNAALVKAYTLHFDSSLSSAKAKDWDEQREMLIKFINSNSGSKTDSEQNVVSERIDVPEDFFIGYEKAEFEKFNSPAFENGLSNSRIYLYCTLIETDILNSEEYDSIFGVISDESGNKWLTLLHVLPCVSETAFDRFIGKEIVLRGVYGGFSEVVKMPSITLDELIVLDTGEKVMGLQKLMDYNEEGNK